MKNLVSILILICSFQVQAKAEFTESLYVSCRGVVYPNEYDAFSYGRCSGFVDGYYLRGQSDTGPYGNDKFFCVPPKLVSLEQLIIAFVKYVEGNPKKSHLEEHLLLFLSWKDAFPCPGK